MNSTLSVRLLAAAAMAAGSLAIAAPAGSQQMPTPARDYKAAPAGKYAIDPHHTGLVARVPHVGFSYSIFRFETVSGTLTWDPANPRADSLSVTVDPKSIATAPVPGFSDEINQKFLHSDKFAEATFVSTAFHPDGPDKGAVEGDLTLMGVTKHVTFHVDLVGAGKGMRGAPVIGVTARTELDPSAYGLPKFITGPIELVIDSEFDGQG
ncbi:MAG TPA: YceI family protein [Caulobacteraceae bacterium]|jgi:polyisoprenoid-binding protein YceI